MGETAWIMAYFGGFLYAILRTINAVLPPDSGDHFHATFGLGNNTVIIFQ